MLKDLQFESCKHINPHSAMLYTTADLIIWPCIEALKYPDKRRDPLVVPVKIIEDKILQIIPNTYNGKV